MPQPMTLQRSSPSGSWSQPNRRPQWLTSARFTASTLFACLILQRFALPFGSLALSIAAPVGLLLMAWGVTTGVLSFDRRRLACFLGLFGIALLATALHDNMPVSIAPRISLNSLVYWLLITGFATVRFATPMPEEEFFAVTSRWLTVVAAAGVIAFVGQFVGLTLFTFSHIVPERFLIEREYAVVDAISGTHILRANGFFLVEPSVFSQFMALAVIIEFLYFRRPLQMGLYAAGLLVSVSGTGWLVLVAFALSLVVTGSPRRMGKAVALVGVFALAVIIASMVLPAITHGLLDRSNELSESGSSGYARFVTPFMALFYVLHDVPRSLLTGLGPGASQDMLLPFRYWLNTPVKITIEYGVLGLTFYLGLLLTARRTTRQRLLVLPLMVLLMFTGGYQDFPPVLFSVLLIMTVPVLREDTPVRSAAAGEAPRRRWENYG